MNFEQIIARIRRALMLDPAAFEEVRDDATYTPIALGIVAVAVLLAAIGAWLWAETVLDYTPDGWFADTVILGTIFTIVLFAAGLVVIYLMMSQVFRETSTIDGVIRVAALGHVPYALSLLIFIPEIGFAFGIASVIAMFYYTTFGLRAAYPNLSTTNVVLAVAAGFAVWGILLPLITSAPDNNWVTGTFVYSLSD